MLKLEEEVKTHQSSEGARKSIGKLSAMLTAMRSLWECKEQ